MIAWRIVCSAMLACLGISACADALAGSTSSYTYSAGNYPGSRDRHYKVYVPSGLPNPAPMVMALHGCDQTHDDVLDDWGLKAAADRYGFLLVAPFITSYDGIRNVNCWGFWLDEQRHEGAGEVEDLHRIAQQVEKRFSVDPKRRFITGLSSGGAMTVAEAIAYNEYWAAAASAAGEPYGEDAASVSPLPVCPGGATFHTVAQVAKDMRSELNSTYAIPLLILQNNKDCVVVPPAGRNLRDAHLKVFGDAAHDTPSEARAGEHSCAPVYEAGDDCVQTIYTGDGSGRSLVETVFYDGPQATPNPDDQDLGHYWIGGEAGREGRYAMRRGPSYPDLVWDFFARHTRTSLPVSAPCATLSDSPAAHVDAGRADRGGTFKTRALAIGDNVDIGFAWDAWSTIELYRGPSGAWYARKPAGCS